MISLLNISLFLALTLVIGFVLLALYLGRNYSYWKKKGVPHLKPRPIFGNFYEVFFWKKSLSDILDEFYKNTTEPFLGFYILDVPFLVINDLELVKRILVQDFSHFMDRTLPDNYKNDPIGDQTLFYARGSQWIKQKKRLAPVFSAAKLKSKANRIIELGKLLSDHIGSKMENGKNIIEVRQMNSRYVIDAITYAFYGLQDSCLKFERNPFMHFAETLFKWTDIWQGMQVTYLYLAQSLLRLIPLRIYNKEGRKFFRKLTWDLIKDRNKMNIKNNDLIDILKQIKNKENINENSEDGDLLTSLVTQIFAAGFESSSTTMSFALYELAKNSMIQRAARKEIRNLLQRDGCLTYANISSLSYLDRVFSETLRLYPIAPFLDRRCTEDYNIPGTKLTIEKGQMLFIPMFAIHKDPKYFWDPERFDPDRFLPERVQERCARGHELTYFPFGEGPRKCPGGRFGRFTSVCGLAFILSHFEIKLCDKSHKAAAIDKRSLFMQPIEGIFLEFVDLKKKP